MQKPYRNVCCRCGKDRIVVRVWTEKLENSIIENTQTICPDKECQEATERDIEKQINKRLLIDKRRKESIRSRRRNILKNQIQLNK